METRCTRSYWVTRPRKGELRIKQDVHGRGDDMSWVRTEYSGISVGTERLVGLGEVPPECTKHMPCRYMEGDLALPVKYGSFPNRNSLSGLCKRSLANRWKHFENSNSH